jgi:hypothetical protein
VQVAKINPKGSCTSSPYCKSSSRDLGTFRTPFIGLIIRVVRRGLISKATAMVARECVLLAMRGVNTVLASVVGTSGGVSPCGQKLSRPNILACRGAVPLKSSLRLAPRRFER